MDRTRVEQIIEGHLKPIYGFALKRCACAQDAEDLAQEIALRAYRMLTKRDDVEDTGRYIWAIAHNALANHYRARRHIGPSVDSMAGYLSDPSDMTADYIARESADRLRSEIAYLSGLQRQIVIAYYYENRRQSDIAEKLGIPVGTVKWHLFEARKELKRGMDIMRKPSDLKFNPVRFSLCGTSGSVGTMGGNARFFRSALSQNIAYAAYRTPMSINELADALGVSPVYVESEVEFLSEYGFMLKKGEKYLTNILIDEITPELARLHNEMYSRAAGIFANELYDALSASDIWDDPALDCGKRDKNYLMWALIPYVAAQSGEHMMESSISFDDAATLRPDGGHNICYAMLEDDCTHQLQHFDSMQQWCGPCWNANDAVRIWLCDSQWSARRMTDAENNPVSRDLQLLTAWRNGEALGKYELAYLAQRGYLSISDAPDGGHTILPGCVHLKSRTVTERLLSFGNAVREKHAAEFEALKQPYVKATLDITPAHMHTAKKYGMQFIYYADGWFTLNCIHALLENGKLKLPPDDQKQSLTTIILPES